MLQPLTVEHTTYQDRPVIIAAYRADADMAHDAGVAIFSTVYLAFYRAHDLADMRNLFFPGDRAYYARRDDALAEIVRCGFDD